MKSLYLIIGALILLAALSLGFAFNNNQSSLPQSSMNQTNESSSLSPSVASSPSVTDASGLVKQDITVGTGAEAKDGDTVTVNYRGTLQDGTQFDSSYQRNQPFSFKLGAGMVIKGWDLGVAGMREGGERKLTIPASLGYGDAGVPNVIPGGATLIFDVTLIKVQSSS